MTHIHLRLFALLLWAGAAPACSASRATPDLATAAPIAVRTAPVLRQRVGKPIVATGVVAAKSEIKASFKVGGIVASVVVDDGDPVRRGQVLAVLRSTEVDAAFEQVQQAVIKAERDLARVTTLYDDKAATREQFDDATTAVAVATAQLRAAGFNRDHAVIYAPGNGRVLHRLVEPDELVAAGQPVLVLAGDDAGWVLRAGLTDRDVARVATGNPAQVELSAWPGTTLQGTIREIAAAATPVGTYQIEVGFAAPGVTLRAGLIGRIHIEPAARGEVTLIPAVALRDGDGKTATVWSVERDGSVASHPVSVAFLLGDMAALDSGLVGLSAVVTDGAAYLSANSRVEVMPAAALAGGVTPSTAPAPVAEPAAGREP